jgi:hypothetical protein
MRHELSDLARAEIDALEAEGIRLEASDVVHINALAQRVETPQSRMALARGIPVPVGGVYLWPMTLAAGDWFQRVGGELRGQRLQTWALAYAMAHGREQLPEDLAAADAAVTAWARALRCRMGELEGAIRQVVQQDDQLDTGETGPSAGPGNISMMLAAMTHTAPDVWEYQVSIPYALAMLDTLIAQNAADGHSTKHDPRIKAERALGLLVNRIRKRRKGAE